MMFNDIAKKLTGIQTDLIKQNQNIRTNDNIDPGAVSSYAANQNEEQKGRFKLGQKGEEEGKAKKEKKCC